MRCHRLKPQAKISEISVQIPATQAQIMDLSITQEDYMSPLTSSTSPNRTSAVDAILLKCPGLLFRHTTIVACLLKLYRLQHALDGSKVRRYVVSYPIRVRPAVVRIVVHIRHSHARDVAIGVNKELNVDLGHLVRKLCHVVVVPAIEFRAAVVVTVKA